MGILNNLRTAKFRNVELLYESNSIQFGRKTITHEFINSNQRFVEDQGELPRTITLNVIINSNNRSDYVAQKKRLEDAIAAQGGRGTLILPTYNEDFNVVAKIGSVNENIRELNTATYTLNFEVSALNRFPAQSQNVTKSAIAQRVEAAQNAIKEFFDDTFNVKDNSFFKKVEDAGNDFNIVTNAINSEINKINGNIDIIGDLITDLNEFNDSINNLMQTPSELTIKFNNIFNNFKLVTDNFGDLFVGALAIVGLTNPDIVTSTESPRGQSILDNSEQTFNLTNVNALSVAFQAAANTDYGNVQEVEVVQTDLNNAFLLVNETLDYDSLIAMEDLRDETDQLLNNLKISLPNVISERVNTQSVTFLTYDFYGSTDNDTEILSLNNIEDPAFISGDIQLLSEV